jgi:hypothetical protein
VVIFRIEKDPAYWQLKNDEFFCLQAERKNGHSGKSEERME